MAFPYQSSNFTRALGPTNLYWFEKAGDTLLCGLIGPGVMASSGSLFADFILPQFHVGGIINESDNV